MTRDFLVLKDILTEPAQCYDVGVVSACRFDQPRTITSGVGFTQKVITTIPINLEADFRNIRLGLTLDTRQFIAQMKGNTFDYSTKMQTGMLLSAINVHENADSWVDPVNSNISPPSPSKKGHKSSPIKFKKPTMATANNPIDASTTKYVLDATDTGKSITTD